jgi:hypothetical protein
MTESRPKTKVLNGMVKNMYKGNNFAIPTHKNIVGDMPIKFYLTKI